MWVKWTRRALSTLDAIAGYIAKDRPEAARRTVERIRSAIQVLADFPAISRPGRVPGTRELVVTGTPFIIPYRVQSDQLEIIIVLHGARKWPEKL